MEDDPGGVDDPPQPWRGHGPQLRGHRCVPAGGIGGPLALGCDLFADRLDDPLASVLLDELGVSRLVEERPYSRQGYRKTNPGIVYPTHVPTEIRLAGSKKGAITYCSRLTRWKNWNAIRTTTQPAQISRRLMLTS